MSQHEALAKLLRDALYTLRGKTYAGGDNDGVFSRDLASALQGKVLVIDSLTDEQIRDFVPTGYEIGWRAALAHRGSGRWSA